jgi:hypothetical protein
MTNLNKEIALFLKKMKQTGLLKSNVDYMRDTYLVKIESNDQKIIQYPITNSKCSIAVFSENSKNKFFAIIVLWLEPDQKTNLFKFEKTEPFLNFSNHIKIFSFENKSYINPLITFNFFLFFKEKVQLFGKPSSRYILESKRRYDEYEGEFPILEIKKILMFDYFNSKSKTTRYRYNFGSDECIPVYQSLQNPPNN